ncbi:Med18 protein, partial [Ancylostoma caninum]
MDGGQASKAALTSMPYQCQELILYGSVFADNLPDLERRLTGLCDPGSTEFHEHDLSFSLRTGTDPDVTIRYLTGTFNLAFIITCACSCCRLRRRFNVDSFNSHQWQFRYIGGPEPDQKCPVIVRKVIDSIAYSHLMMDFVKTLGLRMDYEYIAKGTVWTNGKMKVVLSQIQKTEKAGHYDQANLKRFSDSYLVEMSVCLPDSAEYTAAAKQLRDFADQLLPLVEME